MKTKDRKEDLSLKLIQDFKTPMGAQINALESFLKTASNKINQEEIDLIKLTLNSCLQTKKLIENFFDTQKLTKESFKLNYEKFDIASLIKDVIKDFEILFKYSKLKISFNYKEKLIITADKYQIRRVIENILTNSINNAYNGSLIEIILKKEKNNLIFKIKNESPYIEEAVLKEIFEKQKKNFENNLKISHNLALYISKEIIRAHFGKMIAKSETNNVNTLGFILSIT